MSYHIGNQIPKNFIENYCYIDEPSPPLTKGSTVAVYDVASKNFYLGVVDSDENLSERIITFGHELAPSLIPIKFIYVLKNEFSNDPALISNEPTRLDIDIKFFKADLAAVNYLINEILITPSPLSSETLLYIKDTLQGIAFNEYKLNQALETQDPQSENYRDIFALIEVLHEMKINLLIKEFESENASRLLASSDIYENEVHNLLKEGKVNEFIDYLQLDTPNKTSQVLVEGPRNKNWETVLVEKLIKETLQNFDAVKLYQGGPDIYFTYSGLHYNLSDLLGKTDFNQMEFTEEQLSRYVELSDRFVYSQISAEEDTELRLKEKLIALTYAEKLAILTSTGKGNHLMKLLPKGPLNLFELLTNRCEEEIADDELEQHDRGFVINEFDIAKETILHIAVAISGLNKLPDFDYASGNGDLSKNPDNAIDDFMNVVSTPQIQPQKKYLFRVENIDKDEVNKRKQAIANGGEVTLEQGFLSTSRDKPHDESFPDANSVILFENVKGKDVSSISVFPDEREVLFAPTQVQWMYHKQIEKPNGRKIDVFIVRAVTALLTTPTIEDKDRAEAFKCFQEDSF